MTPIWVGLEVDELSVGSAQVLRTRRAISRLKSDECRSLVDEVATCASSEEVKTICGNLIENAYPELLL